MEVFRNFLRYAGFPLWMAASMLVAVWAWSLTEIPGVAILSASALAVIAILISARVIPFHTGPKAPNETRDDLFAALGSGVGSAGGSILALALASWLAGTIPATSVAAGEWPWAVQFAVALLFTDLVGFVIHYYSHTGNHWLWRIHAMHHSPTRLTWLNGMRFHPLEPFLRTILASVPLAWIGVSQEALAISTAAVGAFNLYKHADADFRFGFLNHVLSTTALHRWHHSVDAWEGSRNLGPVFIFWDTLFGTRYLPGSPPTPPKMGLDGADFPREGVVEWWGVGLGLKPSARKRAEGAKD